MRASGIVCGLPVEPDEVNYRELMKHYELETHLSKMADTKLPTTYHHLLRGVGEKTTEARDAKGDLLSLLQGVPFDRPIEPLPESIVKSALQLPAGSKKGPVLHPLKNRTLSHFAVFVVAFISCRVVMTLSLVFSVRLW